MKGELSIQRSNQDDKAISFRLRLDTGRTVTMTMKPYDFALMITGMSDVECEVVTRNVEIKVAPREPHFGCGEEVVAGHGDYGPCGTQYYLCDACHEKRMAWLKTKDLKDPAEVDKRLQGVLRGVDKDGSKW